ncbi:MAG: LysM peptidoglycan-binding domain-containing protein, partial [Cryomorphaceae bacterium]
MTQIFSKIMPLVLAALFAGCAVAQDFPKRSVNGKDHYVYTVEPGNTLFAISRSFSISIESLKQANEGLDERLEIGREILIPLNAIDRRSARRSDVKTDGEYLLHTVQRKETLFGIAKMYGVTVKDLAELNPDQSVKMSTGMVLRIPVTRSLSVEEAYLEPARNDTFKVHLTAKGETPFSIAKGYGISVDSLANANPGILENLPVDTWITVPVHNVGFLLKRKEELKAEIPEAKYDMPSGARDEYRIALMLPFELQYNDSVGNMIERGKDLYVLTEIALEFYRGVLLAADSLEKAGLRARIKVYEVGEDLVSARDVIKKIDADKADLVIGPMH